MITSRSSNKRVAPIYALGIAIAVLGSTFDANAHDGEEEAGGVPRYALYRGSPSARSRSYAAMSAKNAGDRDRAIAIASSLVAEFPTASEVWALRALIRGPSEESADDLERAMELSPADDLELLLRRAEVLSLMGHVAEAEDLLERSIEREGPRVVVLHKLIELATHQGERERALAYWDKLPPADRDSPEGNLARAELYAGAGDRRAAHDLVNAGEAALARLPSNRRESPRARQTAAALAKLREELRRTDRERDPSGPGDPVGPGNPVGLGVSALLLLGFVGLARERRSERVRV